MARSLARRLANAESGAFLPSDRLKAGLANSARISPGFRARKLCWRAGCANQSCPRAGVGLLAQRGGRAGRSTRNSPTTLDAWGTRGAAAQQCPRRDGQEEMLKPVALNMGRGSWLSRWWRAYEKNLRRRPILTQVAASSVAEWFRRVCLCHTCPVRAASRFGGSAAGASGGIRVSHRPARRRSRS